MKLSYGIFVFCAILATTVAFVRREAPMEMAVTTPADEPVTTTSTTKGSLPVTMPQDDTEEINRQDEALTTPPTVAEVTEQATAQPVTTPEEPTSPEETVSTEAPVPVTTPQEDTTTTINEETTATAESTTTSAKDEENSSTATSTSDITTSETTENLSTTTEVYVFECIASGFYAKQNSCTEFYWCMREGSTYKPYLLRCPDGQKFQAGVNYCDANYECTMAA